jgi:hypothetical protein
MTKKLRPNLVLATLTLALALGSVARPAEACGPSPRASVSQVIGTHFASVNQHARKAILALWAPKAPVTTSGTGHGGSSTVPIERAVERWVSAKQPVEFKVEDLRFVDGENAEARLRVAFEGKPWEDVVKLRSDDKGAWHLVSKVSRPLEKAASDSPY